MKRAGLIEGNFDPVTEEEIQRAREILKREHLDILYLAPLPEGRLDVKKRTALLRKAVHPFRRLRCGYPAGKNVYYEKIVDDAGEAEVRHGFFSLAASGTKRSLIENGYYLEEVVDFCCKPKRAAHSRSVAEVCRELAEAHHLDSHQAWIAGMLHDVTKKWPDEKAADVVRIYYPEMLSWSPKVWHSYTAPVFLYQEMGLRDRKILRAIECHTIGNGTGALDHILYIADKCEPLRGYDCSYQLALSRKSLSAGAAYVLEESRKYILEKEGVHV